MLQGLAGDAAAHSTLLEALSRMLRGYLRNRLGSHSADAEDLLQETLIAVHERRHSYDVTQPFTPWVYAVARYKLIAFVVAGAIAGVAGALYAQLVGSITPDAFLWTTSGEALLMVIIGGTGTLGGAVLGAAAFILLQSLVSSYTERWMLILGLTFILFVLFAPGGIVGALRGRVGLRA